MRNSRSSNQQHNIKGVIQQNLIFVRGTLLESKQTDWSMKLLDHVRISADKKINLIVLSTRYWYLVLSTTPWQYYVFCIRLPIDWVQFVFNFLLILVRSVNFRWNSRESIRNSSSCWFIWAEIFDTLALMLSSLRKVYVNPFHIARSIDTNNENNINGISQPIRLWHPAIS